MNSSQSERYFVGTAVSDPFGARLGRVVGVDCALDQAGPAWFFLRLPGWHRHLRAVPARGAHWRPAGPVIVAYSREFVIASPPLPTDGVSTSTMRDRLNRYYSKPLP